MSSCKDFYWHLIIQSVNHTPKCVSKWSTVYTSLNNTHNTTWKKI